MDIFAVTEGVLPEPEKPSQQEEIPTNGGEEANKFQRAISAWRGAHRSRLAIDDQQLTVVT
jgi:hypothetical protein